VLQSTSLDAEVTVRDTLTLYARLYPAPRPVREVLELTGLTADAQTRVGALSGGQRRRVDLAIGIIGRPEVLFLDEPTTGLDPEARRGTWQAITDLTVTGTTVILTTHYIDEAEHLASRLLLISAGRILADTTPQKLRARGGPTTIRCPLPSHALATGPAGNLPAALTPHLDQHARALIIRSDDTTVIAAALTDLLAWAQDRHLDLTGLQVGPPSLEDAYLTAIGRPPTPARSTP
jgi:ABC-2 type transport system ATP-binding protein